MIEMVKEDYVSFEIAKLLKEKGFIGESEIGDRCGFYEQNKEYPSQINLVYDDLNNSELEWNECLRFTHQMAMKWLRKEHDIFIKINMIQDGMYDAINDFVYKEPIFQYEIIGFNGNDVYWLRGEFNSYEEAIESAIKYCLENLI